MRSKTCRGFNACSGIFISGRLWNEAITLVFALGCALFCLIQTVSHAFLYIFGRWLARTIFFLRNRNG